MCTPKFVDIAFEAEAEALTRNRQDGNFYYALPAIWLALSRDPVYLTTVGEQRSLVLTDGSSIELNPRSKIQVRYSEHERTVELLNIESVQRPRKGNPSPS